MEKCQGTIWYAHRSVFCDNKATLPSGYCRIHDPDTQAAKRKKSHEVWKAKYASARILSAAAEVRRVARLALVDAVLSAPSKPNQTEWEAIVTIASRAKE